MTQVKKYVKKGFSILLVLILCANCLAAVVSDDDGTAFITKAEFNSLKQDFQNQIDQYNISIDSKIDGAIAAYLAGLRVGSTGDFTPNIRDLEDVKWRDKLIKIGKVRTWSTGTAYTDTTNFPWEATYDTILKSGGKVEPTSVADTNNCKLQWTVNGTFGHGGWVLSMQADFDGLGYWKKARWGAANNAYNFPNYPMIRYRKNMYESTVEKKQTLVGWFDFGACFTNANSGYCDTSVGADGKKLNTSTDARGSALMSAKYAADAGPGRDSNCWGISYGSTAASAATSEAGWRPTKDSTIFFPPHGTYNGAGRMQQTENCQGYSVLPIGVPFPITSEAEWAGTVKDDNLHTLMLGSTNEQEVNYYVERDDLTFWSTRPEWPLDCYVTATLRNIYLRKVGINQQPNEASNSGGPWGNGTNGNRAEDQMNNDSYGYKYCFGFLGTPTSLSVSIPTKPHKKLKLLDSNFISTEGDRYLKFGEGLCITNACPEDAEVTLQFELTTNPEFAANNCKATIELCDKNFNDTAGAEFYDIDSGAKRLNPTSTKWLLDTTKSNNLKITVKKGKAIYARFSPNDNSGINYVSVSNFHANYLHE